MKKILIIIMCLYTLAATAQESKDGIHFGLGMGFSNSYNYSAVSLFPDANMTYNGCSAEQLTISYRCKDNFYAGLCLDITSGQTSHQELNEQFALYSIKLELGNFYPLTKSLELLYKVSFGALIGNNTFTYASQNNSIMRYGYEGSLYCGLQYNLSHNSQIGFGVELPTYGYYSGQKGVLPDDMVATNSQAFSSIRPMISYSLKL